MPLGFLFKRCPQAAHTMRLQLYLRMSHCRSACGAAQDTRHNRLFLAVTDNRHARSIPWVIDRPLADRLLVRNVPWASNGPVTGRRLVPS